MINHGHDITAETGEVKTTRIIYSNWNPITTFFTLVANDTTPTNLRYYCVPCN